MKQKISRISVLGIVTLLLVSLLALVTPVSADIASWSAEIIPSTIDEILGPAGIDVRDMAVATGGTTIYAVSGDSVSDNVVYKSTTAGASWTTLDTNFKADLVAVAPDDTNLVAIANSSTPEVYITIDGGTIWHSLGIPQQSGGGAAAAIYDIAISKACDDINYIAVAGEEASDVANAWYYNIGVAAPAWKETNTLPGFNTNANEVAAVAFSPNFPEDEIMVAISVEHNVSAKLQILSLDSKKWNASANFARYPVTIVSDDGITGLNSASIAMAPDYLADESDRRTVFIGLAVSGDGAATATSGIYRLKDHDHTTLKAGIKIHSIAYNGTNLVAGRYDTINVHRSANPLATEPTFDTVATMKGPGGENKVVVAWAGSRVLAGTSGDESAFAVSRDNGDAFNDISLIDTTITKARDVTVSADGSKVYLVTDNGTNLSLWRKASVWERILSKRGATDYIVRIAPENADVIYLAKKDATTIYYNDSGGASEWSTRSCIINIQDLAVESDDVVYVLNSDGSVSKSTNACFTWGIEKSTELDSGATIVSVSTNNLLVGSQDGYVAYSTNGNSSWTEIDEVFEDGAGKVQVIADENFDTNKIIYAASDTAGQNIQKWQIGTSTEWSDIFRNTVLGGIYGLAVDDGTLYALEFNTSTGQTTLWRCLTPKAATRTSNDWSSSSTTADTDVNDDEVHLNATPRALKISQGKLWAVKTNVTNKLYSFTDIYIDVTLMKPAPGSSNPVSAITGLAHDIPFTWDRPPEATEWDRPPEATEYELEIALDRNFTSRVTTVTIATEESSVLALVGPHQTGVAKVNFLAGVIYYWRVRVSRPLQSLYSEPRNFVIEPVAALVPELLTPTNGSTDISRKPSFSWTPVSGTSEYQFMLSANATMTAIIIDTNTKNAGFTMTEDLGYGNTYFWKVRAIEPIESDWSTLANFTVQEGPVEPVPPVVVQQLPPTIIKVPAPPPQNIVTFAPPPPAAPLPIIPNYALRAAIIIVIALLLVVIAFILKPATGRPSRVAKGLGDGWGKLREGLVTYFQDLKLIRTLRELKVRIAGTGEAEANQPISFAAKSFLWMMTSEEKEGSKRLLSADEEQSLGRILASRIQALAKKHLLYQEFPKDASLFLYLWSHYGSRDETNHYLTNSFQSRPENVIQFLKCYLTTPHGLEPGITRQSRFDRTQYDSVATVVNPNQVLQALTRLYGPGLDGLEGKDLDVSPDKAIAAQFVRIHHQVKSEREKAEKTDQKSGTGLVRADAR